MPRIRTIKPDFWKHEDLSDLPPETHLMAAALLNYADDEGYFNANPKLVKADCCPLREDSTNVRRALEQLASIGYIDIGECEDGKKWGRVRKFCEHQRVDRARESKIKHLTITWEASTKNRRILDEGSTPEGNGMDGNGSEGNGMDGDDAPKGAPPKPKKNEVQRPDDIDEQVWSDFLAHRRQKKAKLTPTAWKTIRKQLDLGIEKGHDPNEMLAVAMAAGWQGFEFEWYLNRKRKQTANGGKPPMADDYSGKHYEGTPDDELPASLR